MRLVHWGKRPIKEVWAVCQTAVDSKPWGLWVSDEHQEEDSWRSWVVANTFAPGHFVVPTEVVLRPAHGLLHLRGPSMLDAFTREFGALMPRFPSHPPFDQMRYIDWQAVGRRYAGILITPYVWQRRMEGPASRWYYPWDCASGCIWDPSAIEELRPCELEMPDYDHAEVPF